MALRGSLLVAQAGGPTAVINASLQGIVEEARRHGEIEGVLGARHGLLGILHEDLVDLEQEDAVRLRVVGHSPAAALGTSRRRFLPTDGERVLAVLAAHRVRFLLYVGGNDSAETAHAIQMLADERGYALRCLCVPKTIDNDLAFMDHTPGYGSAARYVAMATRDCGYDAASITPTDQVTILEVMGRNAGWLAAASVLARATPDEAPHLVYVPERPVIASAVVRQVSDVVGRLGHVVIVVAETVRDEKGEPWARLTGEDGFGHRRLVGAAERLGAMLTARLGLGTRYDRPGTLQRAAGLCVSAVDWDEAYLVGRMAVVQAVNGAQDVMVTLLRQPGPLYACATGLAPLAEVARVERRLPPEFLDENGTITPAFVAYARPLIGGVLPPYARLQGIPVPKLLQQPATSSKSKKPNDANLSDHHTSPAVGE